MKVLLTGGDGQVGRAVRRSAPADIELVVTGRDSLDITNAAAVMRLVSEVQPSHIVNCAAYTNVDGAEAHAQAAFLVNSDGTAHLAKAASGVGARLVHLSTDFVFDGLTSRAYKSGDTINPVNRYGASKAAGERHVLDTLGDDGLVLRTSWVYSAAKGNFLTRILQLLGERDELRIVDDQVGTPTCADSVASAIWYAIRAGKLAGIYHWTDSGVASWYDFAKGIEMFSRDLGIITGARTIRPIRSAQYPTPAKRPPFSVLDKSETRRDFQLEPRHWLEETLSTLKEYKTSA